MFWGWVRQDGAKRPYPKQEELSLGCLPSPLLPRGLAVRLPAPRSSLRPSQARFSAAVPNSLTLSSTCASLAGDGPFVTLTVRPGGWAGARTRQVRSDGAHERKRGVAACARFSGLRRRPALRRDWAPRAFAGVHSTARTPTRPGRLKPGGPRRRPPFRAEVTGKRAFPLYGKGARTYDSLTPASFGGKNAAFGLLWWRAEDGLVRRAAGRVGRSLESRSGSALARRGTATG